VRIHNAYATLFTLISYFPLFFTNINFYLCRRQIDYVQLLGVDLR